METVGFTAVTMVMASAAYHDLRCREVPDIHWMLITVVAAVMCPFRLDGFIHAVFGSVSILLMSAYMLCGRIVGVRAVPFLVVPVIIQVYLFMDGEGAWTLVVPVMFLAFLLFYHLGLLRGGADAKAMMSLSMASPFYPWQGVLWGSGPVDGLLLNPPFIIFTSALVLSTAYHMTVVIRCGSPGARTIRGFRMPVSEAERSFVWPVEDVVDGHLRRIQPPDDPGAVYRRLRDDGFSEVEVTPMIPFVLPIAISYVAVLVLGDPLAMLVR